MVDVRGEDATPLRGRREVDFDGVDGSVPRDRRDMLPFDPGDLGTYFLEEPWRLLEMRVAETGVTVLLVCLIR